MVTIQNFDVLSTVLRAALLRPELSALQDMLRAIAKSLSAYGCSLWKVRPEYLKDPQRPRDLPVDAKVFVLASGLEDELVCAYHDLPIMQSATGTAIREGRINIENALTDLRVDRKNPFVLRSGVKSLGSLGITLHDGTPGAITVYRKEFGGLSEEEFRLLEMLAPHVPILYQTIIDRASFGLLDQISQEIQAAELDLSLPARTVMQRLAETIAKGLQCLETSIYLEDTSAEPGVISLMATTCAPFIRLQKYRVSGPDPDQGLTAWIYRTGETISVFDLSDFDQSKYKGLVWTDEIGVEARTREVMGLKPEDMAPPNSFMAVPVAMGKGVLGVLRCCTARRGPYYFSEREVQLLSMIAGRICQYWSNRLGREAMVRENQSWKIFVAGVGELNQFAQQQLKGMAVPDDGIAARALEVASQSIPGAEILDATIYDSQKQEMSLLATHGDAWSGPARADYLQKLPRRISDDPLRDALSKVFHLKVTHIWKAGDIPPAGYIEVFPNVTRAIFTPLLADGQFLGLLAIRSTSGVEFGPEATSMAELLGQQISLYHRLATSLSKQKQTYAEFVHQLRSPIFMAYKRSRLIEGAVDDFNLKATRGLLAKSQRVVRNHLNVFNDLAAGKKVEAKLEIAYSHEMVKLLIEVASDNQVLWSDRNVSFHVDTVSFESGMQFVADLDLLEQAVNNLIDNAGKYSDRNSTVVIGCKAEPDRRLSISFRNRGIILKEENVKNAVMRGWRGKVASQRTAEGSGIGLWIVEHVMIAMRGKLEIVPTDSERYTVIKLILADGRSPRSLA